MGKNIFPDAENPAQKLNEGKYEDPDLLARFFYPGLFLFISRFLEIYDSSLKGKLTKPAMEDLANERKVIF
jgi:hypothetical protein